MGNLVSVSLNLRFLLAVVNLIQYIFPFSNSTNLQENLENFGKALQLYFCVPLEYFCWVTFFFLAHYFMFINKVIIVSVFL